MDYKEENPLTKCPRCKDEVYDLYDFKEEFLCDKCYDEAEDLERENLIRGIDNDFADPYGNSALRKATKDNPRNQPCPTCGEKNVLTPKDVDLGYQCDNCADRAEMGFDY